MTRIALGIEYDGTRFSGWQRQHHALTVQQVLEEGLSRVADHPVAVTCAGRTDAGVHATQQVVHFDTASQRPERAWIRGVNSNLPEDVGVVWMREVPADFHARFSATARSYRYAIRSHPVRPVLSRHRVSWTWKPLDAEPMAAAAQTLLGEHDFTSFRAVACQARHPVRTIHSLTVKTLGGHIVIDVKANAFLHHMVRNIAGVLMAVGAGEQPVAWVSELLQARDRTAGGVTAPAQGLYFVAVEYPRQFGLPVEARFPAFA
jgi:tRNA pseudouridine38-40 synthase